MGEGGSGWVPPSTCGCACQLVGPENFGFPKKPSTQNTLSSLSVVAFAFAVAECVRRSYHTGLIQSLGVTASSGFVKQQKGPLFGLRHEGHWCSTTHTITHSSRRRP